MQTLLVAEPRLPAREADSPLVGLPPAAIRSLLPAWIDGYLEAPPDARARFSAALASVLERAADADIETLLATFATAGDGYRVHAADPLARRMSRASIPTLFLEAELTGLSSLRAALGEGPCLWAGNHVSYADTQVTDAVLARDAEDIADALVTIAGPKVYETPFRRLAAVSLNTLKTAQSTSLAQNGAALSWRDVARIALATVRETGALVAAGRPVLLYPEGSRTRTGRLGPFLRAVTRYFEIPNMRIVPVALSGTAEFFPLEARGLRPAAVRLSFGEPVCSGEWGARRALEETWRRIAAMLPERQKPASDTPAIV